MEQREGNSKHWGALTLKARNLVVGTALESFGGGSAWRRGKSLLKLPARAVKERAQSEGRDDRSLGRESKNGKFQDIGRWPRSHGQQANLSLPAGARGSKTQRCDRKRSSHQRQRAKTKVCLGPRERA